MGFINPVSMLQRFFDASMTLLSPLVATIATQDQDKSVDTFEVMEIKASIRQSNHAHQVQEAGLVYDHLSPQMKRCVDLDIGDLLQQLEEAIQQNLIPA